MKREQKKSTKLRQRYLFSLWDTYANGECNSYELLTKTVSLLGRNFPLIYSLSNIFPENSSVISDEIDFDPYI